MDYLRIYNELIEHRKMMPKLEGVPYERHHIKAKCQGGTDDPENLIDLTLSDHYMAHMLMAHAFGGSLWHAAQLMAATRTVDGVSVKNRRTFAIVRRKLSENMGQYVRDPNIYKIRNLVTGEIFEATQYDLQQKHGVHPSSTSALVTGSVKYTGTFCLASTDIEVKALDPVKYAFRHIESGKVYYMTRKEFVEAFNVDRSLANRLVEGRQKHGYGFCLDHVVDFGGRRGTGERLAFKNFKTGDVVVKSCREMAETYGGRQDDWRAVAKGFGLIKGDFCSEDTPVDHPAIIRPRNSRYTIKLIGGKSMLTGTAKELAEASGAHYTSMNKLLSGKNKSCRGYVLVGIAPPEGGAVHITESPNSSESSQSQLPTPSQPHRTEPGSPCVPQAQAA